LTIAAKLSTDAGNDITITTSKCKCISSTNSLCSSSICKCK
jgi:hypothetical protein